ncbi:MAG: zinc-ribbon domain-containing protein [Deltaproteobacteria bacterium]|nr:zinc-ribbon domain-containing protein [Deltaproteobacteria bacterium]
MPMCPQCGRAIERGNNFCPHCGEKIPPVGVEPSCDKVYEEDYRSFIGKNADRYLSKFRKFQFTGRDGFAVTWNWPAFWLGFIWMLYRKMYLWALLAFIIALTPVGFPLIMIGWGIVGNYLYYLHARKKILAFKYQPVGGPTSFSLNELGGVNRWVWFIGIIFFLFLLAVGVLGIMLILYLLNYGFFYWPDFIEI